MQAEVLPGPDLEELLSGAHAAGQREECVSECGHARLPLVHIRHDLQLGQSRVSLLILHEAFRDDAVDVTSGVEN